MTYDDSDCLVVVDGNNGQVCTKCGELKAYGEFGNYIQYRTGETRRHAQCLACMAKRSREYRANNREKLKARDKAYYKEKKHKWVAEYRLRKYGVTVEWLEAKLEEQGKCCSICGEEPSGVGNHSMLHIDHDHDTNEVRDLLCGNCNLAIGHLRENPEIARKAADYLERWGK